MSAFVIQCSLFSIFYVISIAADVQFCKLLKNLETSFYIYYNKMFTSTNHC